MHRDTHTYKHVLNTHEQIGTHRQGDTRACIDIHIVCIQTQVNVFKNYLFKKIPIKNSQIPLQQNIFHKM